MSVYPVFLFLFLLFIHPSNLLRLTCIYLHYYYVKIFPKPISCCITVADFPPSDVSREERYSTAGVSVEPTS